MVAGKLISRVLLNYEDRTHGGLPRGLAGETLSL